MYGRTNHSNGKGFICHLAKFVDKEKGILHKKNKTCRAHTYMNDYKLTMCEKGIGRPSEMVWKCSKGHTLNLLKCAKNKIWGN